MSITYPKPRSSAAALAPKHARLRAVLERTDRHLASRARPGDGGQPLRPDVVEMQRRAVAALKECADVALGLAEYLGEAACPRDVACIHLGDWNHCNACFEEQVSRFFEQADKFLTAVVQSAEPASLNRLAVRPDARSEAKCAEPSSREAFSERAASFTEAQQRVFELLVTGLPNKLIAYEIGVSEATVKAHVSAVLRKLRVRSRAQAIALTTAFERSRNGGARAGTNAEA